MPFVFLGGLGLDSFSEYTARGREDASDDLVICVLPCHPEDFLSMENLGNGPDAVSPRTSDIGVVASQPVAENYHLGCVAEDIGQPAKLFSALRFNVGRGVLVRKAVFVSL